MNKKLNNKGFSLVELIIVIAIMAILVGVLAPQFIKYVEQSRRSTDIQTATEVREAVLSDIADGVISGSAITKKVSEQKPSAISEVPKAVGSELKGAEFVYTADPATGTCSVKIDGGTTADLTTAAGASDYKATGK